MDAHLATILTAAASPVTTTATTASSTTNSTLSLVLARRPQLLPRKVGVLATRAKTRDSLVRMARFAAQPLLLEAVTAPTLLSTAPSTVSSIQTMTPTHLHVGAMGPSLRMAPSRRRMAARSSFVLLPSRTCLPPHPAAGLFTRSFLPTLLCAAATSSRLTSSRIADSPARPAKEVTRAASSSSATSPCSVPYLRTTGKPSMC
mmetsp:Transcript_53394/g.79759  ORF Transcript_53394/g.79759 Transcript_53394/m.79759 type:complete len:203 (+) Transcript_53394:1036-1644(+)